MFQRFNFLKDSYFLQPNHFLTSIGLNINPIKTAVHSNNDTNYLKDFGKFCSAISMFVIQNSRTSESMNLLKHLFSSKHLKNANRFFFFSLTSVYLPTVGVEGQLSRLITFNDTYTIGFLWARDRPFAETSTCTVNNIHKRQVSMPQAGFELAIEASERLP